MEKTVIKAVIFDLDGMLVETEHLKAVSYARTAVDLCPKCATEDEVISAFKDVVGRSRKEVAQTLMKRFGLEDAARAHMAEFKATAPWQAYVRMRLELFDKMLSDPEIIRGSQSTYVVELLHDVRQKGLRTGMTTSSTHDRTCKILDMLGLAQDFDFIATASDVEHGKPDPEVYRLVISELGLPPDECIAIEDALPGIQSTLAAGVHCIAATTDFTRDKVHQAKILDENQIIDDHSKLAEAVYRMIDEQGGMKAAA